MLPSDPLGAKWHICVETPITLPNVAHRVSHQIPAESEMSGQNRPKPPQIKVSHLSPDPPVTLSSHSQQAGGQGRVSRRAGGGYRGTFGFRKRIALQGGVAATVTPVALLCATKLGVLPTQPAPKDSKHLEGLDPAKVCQDPLEKNIQRIASPHHSFTSSSTAQK